MAAVFYDENYVIFLACLFVHSSFYPIFNEPIMIPCPLTWIRRLYLQCLINKNSIKLPMWAQDEKKSFPPFTTNLYWLTCSFFQLLIVHPSMGIVITWPPALCWSSLSFFHLLVMHPSRGIVMTWAPARIVCYDVDSNPNRQIGSQGIAG
jgi:hypothetical protein